MKHLNVPGWRSALISLLFLLTLAGCTTSSGTTSDGKVIVNLGYFPNLTHAVAVVGVGNGTFQQVLGSKVQLQTKTFNAGPAEIQALLAGSIDIAFVGPSPAINGYVQSHGTALRIIAGASSGGASFVVQSNENITSAKDLAGKKLADPQLGGTQDVALRYYLQQNNLKTSDKGGNVQIVSTNNANVLNLFKEGKIDGAWMPEPWATRLAVEGHGKVLVDERTLWPGGQFATTNVVVREDFYKAHPDIVKTFLEADVETVQYIAAHTTDALTLMNNEIKRISGSAIQSNEIQPAFAALNVTYDPLASTISQQANRAYALGFLKSKPDLSGIFDLTPLNQILASKGLAAVSGL